MLERAKWIWCKHAECVNSYVDFKRTFAVKTAEKVEIEISVDGNYALYLNGCFVNSGQYPDYPEYKVFDRLDLSGFLKEGENELMIRAWWPGMDHFSYRVEQAGVIYALFSGDKEIALSDEETYAAVNLSFERGMIPKITEQLGFSFMYDARKEGSEQFAPAIVVEKKATLFQRPIEKLVIGNRAPAKIVNYGTFSERPYKKFGERMQLAALSARYWGPENIWDQENGTEFTRDNDDGIYIIVDLGKESVGFADLELELPEDALVLCGWGEHLQDLRVRSYVGGRNFVFSYYGKKGLNRFMMSLRRLGLRYLQLHIYAPSLRLFYAGIRPTDYPIESKPVEVKDRLHRKIYDISEQTLRHCMHDHYEDCPWREQGLYTMDSRNQMLCTYALFKDSSFPKASLRLFGLSVRDDGLTELCAPARAPITIPSFTAAYLMQLWDYLDFSGDGEFIKEMLPYAEKIAKAFLERIDPQKGVLTCFEGEKYWNFYEWQSGLSGRLKREGIAVLTYDAPLCAFVSMAFQSMEKIYRYLGSKEKAQEYAALWKKLNESAHKLFWNGEYYDTYVATDSGEHFHQAELTQALMLCCGACPEEKRDGLRRILKGDDRFHPITLSYNIFKYDAILQDESNIEWVMEDIAKVWGEMLFNGATTFYETVKGHWDFHNAGSLCHGWAAIPIIYYHKYRCV